MGLNELLQAKRQENLGDSRQTQAYNVRIFGSVARGEADEASDVDVLVALAPDRISYLCAFASCREASLNFDCA